MRWLVPGSIILAGVLVALAVIFGGGSGPQIAPENFTQDGSFGNAQSASAENIRPVDGSDHVRGNPDAPVTVVEFSDLECPFCQRLHPTLTRIIEESGGQVRWVYRHFPLTSIHSSALSASLASECAASLGGNEAFWAFVDALFANQNSLGAPLYGRVAADLGVPAGEFDSCFAGGTFRGEVEADFNDAVSSGGRGTPYVVVINARGETFPFSGALPYEQVVQIVEAAMN